jgi:hypothetical protein
LFQDKAAQLGPAALDRQARELFVKEPAYWAPWFLL